MLNETGLPTVVSGSLRHNDPPLASLDSDNQEAGRILVRHLAERGHRRIAVFGHNDNRPGTHAVLDGVVEGITEAGLPANALVVRFFPPELNAFGTAAKTMLKSENRPTAAIAFGLPRTRIIAQVARDSGISVPDEFEIAFYGEPSCGEDSHLYACAVSRIRDEERVATIGKLLKDISMGHKPKQPHMLIPVELQKAQRD